MIPFLETPEGRSHPSDLADPKQVGHVAGLGVIRFVCALAVVFGHLGFFPLVDGIDRTDPVGRLVAGAYANLVSGPAAVIVFFVISGFCIHYPYRSGAPLLLASYYSRRLTRILLPTAAAIVLGNVVGLELSLLGDTILWSLLAEVIYYLLYPLIYLLHRRVGYPFLIAIAGVFAFLVVLRDPQAGNYPSYGAAFNWALGLPCWLLGCQVAETTKRRVPMPSTRAIWMWRLGVWGASSLCSILRFHSPAKYPWTLNFFALLVALWLVREVTYRERHPPPTALEAGGMWSYSIYLFHLHGNLLFEMSRLPDLGSPLMWFLRIGFVLAACYAFARFIELPTHALARRIGHALLPKAKPPVRIRDVET